MNLLKLNRKQSFFVVFLIVISGIVSILVIPKDDNFLYFSMFLLILTVIVGGLISKVIFPEKNSDE